VDRNLNASKLCIHKVLGLLRCAFFSCADVMKYVN
jgi:hypothetical protein